MSGLLDDVLNVNVDDVEDLPDFVEPPAGEYIVKVEDVETKEYTNENTGETSIIVSPRYSIVQTVQLNNPSEQPVPDGSLFSESFFLKNPAFLKQYLKHIYGDAMQGKTFGDLLNDLKGRTLKLIVKVTRKTVEGEEKVYINTRKQELLD